MPLITYKFVDGHSEEIEVSDEVAAALNRRSKLQKLWHESCVQSFRATLMYMGKISA